jgi:hypothetical protein
MDRTLWIGIGIGAVLSYVASIAANRSDAWITSFFDTRRLKAQSKNKAKAVAFHRLVARLHSGERDRYAYLISAATRAVLAGLITCTSMTIGIVVYSEVPFTFDLLPVIRMEDYGRWVIGVTFLFSTLYGTYLTSRITRGLRDVISALDNFSRFDQEFNARWGADSVPNKPAE